MENDSTIISWLLKGDPSIRWQVLKDLCTEDKFVFEEERKNIAVQGWGKQLLQEQDAEGTWSKALYNPKWTSTTYTMLLLKNLGLLPGNEQAYKACALLLNKGLYHDNGINYFKSLKHSETCVTGMILGILSYFHYKDERVHLLAQYCLDQQLDDGGWNCLSYDGAKHSSFHTTINVLEGLLEYGILYKSQSVVNSQLKGIEFLLNHKLYKSHRTGKVVDSRYTRFSFPTRWRYDVLRALDYLQSFNALKDERMNDGIRLLNERRKPDGTWSLQNKHPGKVFFELETIGEASRWNTLRALRVFKWWQKS